MALKSILEGLSRPYRGLRGMAMSTRGLVSSAHPLASMTGTRVLDRGGNFMDAALAMSAVLNVVEPYNSHLGGDAFMLIFTADDGKLRAINSSGPAPRAAGPGDFPAGVPTRGIGAVSVPGQVGSWKVVHDRFCTMPFAKLLEPATEYARCGFPVNPRLQRGISSGVETLGNNEVWRQVFLPRGRPPVTGEIFLQPDLARTLEAIAAEGPDAFYTGSIASRICEHSKRTGGLLAAEDMAGYEAEVLEPISTSYRDFEVFEQPPVSQGHILLEELNILEGFELSAMRQRSPEVVHIMVESMKLAFSDRHGHSGDPHCVRMPLGAMLSKKHAAARRALIDPGRARDGYPAGSLDGDTTYFTVADAAGNAVSFIQSLFHGFGSGVVVPGTGILLNNRMTGFSLDPSSPNVLEGGKRTMHTLNTYMIFHEDRPIFVGGTPGGDKQVQTNMQIVTALLDWGRNVQEAAEQPRWAGLGGLALEMEARYPKGTISRLREIGHEVSVLPPWGGSGAVQLIMMHPETGALIGGSDPRCDGCAIGL